jgi:GNAT superfamily N-acetyltransferase
MIKIKSKLSHRLDGAVEKLENDIKSKYPQLHQIELFMDGDKNSLFLGDVSVKDQFRGTGVGTRVMNDIVAFADANGVPIVLIPNPENETKAAVKRLILFYNRFGFVVNRGKNVDSFLSDPDGVSMYRRPVKANEIVLKELIKKIVREQMKIKQS